MADKMRLDRLAKAYDDRVHAVRQAVENFGRAYWDSLPNYRDAAMEDLLGAIVPRVKAGQIKTAQLTKAYIEAVAREGGWVENTPPVDVDEVTGQRGVDPMEVYQRPIVTTRSKLAEGKNLQQAAEAGKLRLLQLIGGDMQLAKRAQSRSTMRGAGMKAYRRKLTGRENCALCVVASTQRYWVEDLLPIHPGCDCNVEPLPDHLAHKHVIDEDTLEQVHQAVEQEIGISDRGAREPDYSQMIMTTEHGEYGSVIGWKETRANRRLRLKYGDINISGQFDDYANVTLGQVATGKVSTDAVRFGIRPYATLQEVPHGKPETAEQALSKANRRFWHDLSKFARKHYELPLNAYQINCTRCALTFEMRRRGYDLVAGGGMFETRHNWFDAIALTWRDQDGHFPRWKGATTTKRLIQHMLENEPQGARGLVFVAWDNNPGAGHAFNWEHLGDRIVFYDPQTAIAHPGNIYVNMDEYETAIKRGSMRYIRIDNCTPSDRILNIISTEVD